MEAFAKTTEWMSLDEFLSWDSGDGQKWQLVDGQPQAMAPAKRTHGAILGEIGRLIGNHLAEHRPSCSVIVEPGVVPRVQSKANCRIPAGADLLCRGADGSWTDKPEMVTEGELYFSSIDFRVPVEAIYRTTRLATSNGR